MGLSKKFVGGLSIGESTGRGRLQIPDELWEAAIELARRNGVNPTAAELRLDGAKLKRLMLTAGGPEKAAGPSFVELIAPAAAAVPECSVELEGRPSGFWAFLSNALNSA